MKEQTARGTVFFHVETDFRVESLDHDCAGTPHSRTRGGDPAAG